MKGQNDIKNALRCVISGRLPLEPSTSWFLLLFPIKKLRKCNSWYIFLKVEATGLQLIIDDLPMFYKFLFEERIVKIGSVVLTKELQIL